MFFSTGFFQDCLLIFGFQQLSYDVPTSILQIKFLSDSNLPYVTTINSGQNTKIYKGT